MKIAISCSDQSKEALVDSRFGRAKYFAIYDTELDTFEFISNAQSLDAPQGAGIQAAQHVVNSGAQTVLTGHCGPKAFKVLTSANISIYTDVQGSLADAIEKFKNNDLTKTDQADVEGHWV